MLCIFGYGMRIDSAGAPTRATCGRWCSGDREGPSSRSRSRADVHVVESDATQTGVASHTAIGGACVRCLARGSGAGAAVFLAACGSGGGGRSTYRLIAASTLDVVPKAAEDALWHAGWCPRRSWAAASLARRQVKGRAAGMRRQSQKAEGVDATHVEQADWLAWSAQVRTIPT